MLTRSPRLGMKSGTAPMSCGTEATPVEETEILPKPKEDSESLASYEGKLSPDLCLHRRWS